MDWLWQASKATWTGVQTVLSLTFFNKIFRKVRAPLNHLLALFFVPQLASLALPVQRCYSFSCAAKR
jgi:hypothetical protein